MQLEVGHPATAGELADEDPFNMGQFLVRLLNTGFCESCDSSRYYKAFDEVSTWVADALSVNEHHPRPHHPAKLDNRKKHFYT